MICHSKIELWCTLSGALFPSIISPSISSLRSRWNNSFHDRFQRNPSYLSLFQTGLNKCDRVWICAGVKWFAYQRKWEDVANRVPPSDASMHLFDKIRELISYYPDIILVRGDNWSAEHWEGYMIWDNPEHMMFCPFSCGRIWGDHFALFSFSLFETRDSVDVSDFWYGSRPNDVSKCTLLSSCWME
jgi:hypothetical protein